jgi:hypothetical protein
VDNSTLGLLSSPGKNSVWASADVEMVAKRGVPHVPRIRSQWPVISGVNGDCKHQNCLPFYLMTAEVVYKSRSDCGMVN